MIPRPCSRRRVLRLAGAALAVPALAALPLVRKPLTPRQHAVRRGLETAAALRSRLGLAQYHTPTERHAALRAFAAPGIQFHEATVTGAFLVQPDQGPGLVVVNPNLPAPEREKAEAALVGRLLYWHGPTLFDLAIATTPAEQDHIREQLEQERLFGRAFALSFLHDGRSSRG